MDPTTVTAIGRASLVPRGKNSTPLGGAGPRLPAPGSLHVPPVCERLPCTGRHAPASPGGDAEFPTQDTRWLGGGPRRSDARGADRRRGEGRGDDDHHE